MLATNPCSVFLHLWDLSLILHVYAPCTFPFLSGVLLTDERDAAEASGQSRFRGSWLDFYRQTSLKLHIWVCHRNVIAIDSPSARHQVFKNQKTMIS